MHGRSGPQFLHLKEASMENSVHCLILERGVEVWNQWRVDNPKLEPNLRHANLEGVNLSRANLKVTDLGGAWLNYADLSEADLSGAFLYGGWLIRANLTRVQFIEADLRHANLREANLQFANLEDTDLSLADLRGADLANSTVGNTIFACNDLSDVKGLESVKHTGPSSIGVDTLFMSQGLIPQDFLRNAGCPENLITFLPSLVGIDIEFYSCFISYSHRDEEFSQHLHSRMRSENLRVWYAPEDMKGGRKVHEEIFSAIHIHDKVLVVLSEDSMNSEWVATEIRRARKVEREENRRKLFPIRLIDFEAIQKWECFDADSNKDLAIELREYYIPDFSNWKDHVSFEKEFAKLLRDLTATES